MEQCIRLLNAAGFDANYVHADIGWEFWCKEAIHFRIGHRFIRKHKIGLSVLSHQRQRQSCRRTHSELQNKGLVYYSPIVTMRQHLKWIYVCVLQNIQEIFEFHVELPTAVIVDLLLM